MPKSQLNLNKIHLQVEGFILSYDSEAQLQEELYQMFIASIMNQCEMSPEQLTSRALLFDGLKNLFQHINPETICRQ
ncbi:hypothetical protein [Dyadobacter sp. LHD-138]|uniref:hypothetical protein n=1 Tax=Dyadobacter sp. LHD-138 TaxID=3071413 RepID=UPI0027E1D7DB|nr:hypothetical protein [Dyadobacter sp. LHD-138]MDQ6477839.1 hypothetical protein [Dyadobacter sp. LHD-138]